MSRKRKPVAMPIPRAIDELYWRAKILLEGCDGVKLEIQLHEPLRRMRMALEDYEASRGSGVQGQLELRS